MTALLTFSLMAGSAQVAEAEDAKPATSASGVIAITSAYGMEETVARLKKHVTAKGITFFQEIDQARRARSGWPTATSTGSPGATA